MYIKSLELKNIGPFKNSNITFIKEGQENNTVTIITGENGTGKSIIIDAIRNLLIGHFEDRSKRNIVSNEDDFKIEINAKFDDKGFQNICSIRRNDAGGNTHITKNYEFNTLHNHIYNQLVFNSSWIIDYWSSSVATDNFNISSIAKLDTKNFLRSGITGEKSNLDIVKFLTFFDYLSGSEDGNEQKMGAYMKDSIVKLMNSCLGDFGEFAYISRATLEPIFKIRNQKLTLDKISIGNVYLMQRFLSLLFKCYSAFIYNKGTFTEVKQIPGLLLIDEIENHLHPKWQKKVLSIIKETFPNIQIILTTHSPFIVSSVSNANVYVCAINDDSSSDLVDKTDFYDKMPIEDIIRTPLFLTDSFNEEISKLIESRRLAVRENRLEEAKKIEEILINKNPEYFKYLKIGQI